MKKLWVLVCLVVLGVVGGASFLTPIDARAADGIAAAPRVAPGHVSAKEEEKKAFTGKIVQARTQDGQTVFALQESSSQNLFMLDDQEKAKQFEGKDVKVTGTMNMASNTIHVVNIEAV